MPEASKQAPYRILILNDNMPWGHRSIAKAIYNHLKRVSPENNWQVDYAEVKAEVGPIIDIYTMMARYLPQSPALIFKLMDQNVSVKVLSEIALKSLLEIKTAVNRTQPDLVISTYYVHSHCLAHWKLAEAPPFHIWTVVSDPWSVNLATIIPAGVDMHLVYDEVAEGAGLERGLTPQQILKTGWWVREEMYREYDRTQVRQSLGIVDDRPTLFVGGGSLGTNTLPWILPMPLAVKRPITVIVNTGTDKLAHNLVTEYARAYKRLQRKKDVQILNLGWIDNMAEVLTACDIVFGKAGPNFLMDSVARHKPFVAISHVAGCEDGNLDLIRDRGLGWVKEKPDEMFEFIKDYVEDPKAFHAMFSASLAAEAERNSGSLPKIAERIKQTQNSQLIPLG